MRNRYSEDDLLHIAEWMVDDLRECEDGTVTTTALLLEDLGYNLNNFEQEDLFVVHDALLKEARAKHITLDMSAHGNRAEGLPYNLDYIIRNKKAQIKCPHCGSKNTARVIYGYPIFDKKMQKMLEEGKWSLGGCCIGSVKINGQCVDITPARRCNECGKDFGSAPILFNPRTNTAEDYRDIVTCITFSINTFSKGDTEIVIRKNDNGAAVEVLSFYGRSTRECQITHVKWQKIVNALYSEMYLHEWKKSFVNPYVLDGTQWSLKLSLTNKRRRCYKGSNEYPPYWNELLKIFREFAKV